MWQALLDINATEHPLPQNASQAFVTCAGREGANDCSEVRFPCGAAAAPRFEGEGGTHEHGQRNRARVVEEGQRGNVTWRGNYSAEDPRCVFDGDISSGFQSSHVSSVPQDHLVPIPLNNSSTGLTGRCVLGMTFSRPRVVSRFRMYVRAGYGANVVGARLEAFSPRAAVATPSTSSPPPPPAFADSQRADAEATSSEMHSTGVGGGESGAGEDANVVGEEGVWEELFAFERPLREDEWNDVELSHLTVADLDQQPTTKPHDPLIARHSSVAEAFFKAYSKVRYVGAACGRHGHRDGVLCRCDVGEMEFYTINTLFTYVQIRICVSICMCVRVRVCVCVCVCVCVYIYIPSRCDIGEMEWHHGVISQDLSPLETAQIIKSTSHSDFIR